MILHVLDKTLLNVITWKHLIIAVLPIKQIIQIFHTETSENIKILK